MSNIVEEAENQQKRKEKKSVQRVDLQEKGKFTFKLTIEGSSTKKSKWCTR